MILLLAAPSPCRLNWQSWFSITRVPCSFVQSPVPEGTCKDAEARRGATYEQTFHFPSLAKLLLHCSGGKKKEKKVANLNGKVFKYGWLLLASQTNCGEEKVYLARLKVFWKKTRLLLPLWMWHPLTTCAMGSELLQRVPLGFLHELLPLWDRLWKEIVTGCEKYF